MYVIKQRRLDASKSNTVTAHRYSQVNLVGIIFLVNAVGARADSRVYAAMRRVKRAKEAATAAKRAKEAQRLLSGKSADTPMPKLGSKDSSEKRLE